MGNENYQLLKMKTELLDTVQYTFRSGEQEVHLNPLIGSKIKLEFTGLITDIHDGKPIKKSYAQGYSYKNFISLAQCDTCIVKPELCHYDKGTCREPKWGEEFCMIPHYIYLSLTSALKVGITRHTQVPTRWIDQGATKALPILKVSDRHTSGLIEVEIAKLISDKTDWRAMLRNEVKPGPGLIEFRELVYDQFAHLLDDMNAEDLDEDIVEINYPYDTPLDKVKSFNLDKDPIIEEKLIGIKGQYLIFESGVINIRKYQGYHVKLQS